MSDGGALFVTDSLAVRLQNSVFDGNTAHARGGGMMLQQRSRTTADNVVMAANTARSGGAAYVAAGSALRCNGCHVAANKATATGGAFAVDGAYVSELTELSLHRSAVTANTARVAAGECA